MTEKGYAKLNISLDVSKPRSDGYHDMTMVMQDVSLCDTVNVELRDDNIRTAKTNLRFLPSGEKNLAVKAANVYLEAIGENTGFEITIDKHIPVGAGMAGGSTDAAATLRAMNRIFKERLSKEELIKLSEKVGSDVPYCTMGGTALAEGRGEILTPLKSMPDCTFLICKPDFAVSTPELFKAIDSVKLKTHPDTQGILDALELGDLKGICRRLYNVFEDVNDRRLKVVSEIKSKLLQGGALGAVMTGTGSAVFGIFEDEVAPEELRKNLEKEYGFAVTAKKAESD